jgi:hypothetical protein
MWWPPHEEADHRDADAGEGDEAVAEHLLAREGRNQFGDDAHRRQDHDVDRRVRVEPEQVLEEHRVSADRRIEKAEAEDPLGGNQHDRDGQHRSAEHLDQARGIVRPHEQRQAEPGHPRCPHPVDRHDEVEPRENAREAVDEDAECRGHDGCRGRHRAERRVERPARVETAAHHCVHGEQRADEVDVETQQVQLGKREILRADHQRDQEVSRAPTGWRGSGRRTP